MLSKFHGFFLISHHLFDRVWSEVDGSWVDHISAVGKEVAIQFRVKAEQAFFSLPKLSDPMRQFSMALSTETYFQHASIYLGIIS